MSAVLLALLGAVALVCIVSTLVLVRAMAELERARRSDAAPAVAALQQQLEALREQVRASLEGGRLELDRRLEHTTRVVGDVRRGLGEVDRQMRSVAEATRDLGRLQELLRSPRIRGGVGEQLLADLLAQVLPRANYSLQHEFHDGRRVDAVLRVGEGLIAVDAKFPLDNFHRLRRHDADGDAAGRRAAERAFRNDVRRHVEDIAARYVRPAEGTYEFAMMYIPAEAVYQEAILLGAGDDGLDSLRHALEHRVIPVSPQSFYAYLQVVVFGLRGLSIERRSREILGQLGEVRGRLGRFGASFEVLSRHVGHAHRQAQEARRRLARLDAAVGELDEEGSALREPADDSAPTVPARPSS